MAQNNKVMLCTVWKHFIYTNSGVHLYGGGMRLKVLGSVYNRDWNREIGIEVSGRTPEFEEVGPCTMSKLFFGDE